MKHAIIPIFVSHLGCPHTCVFCNQSRITAVSTEDIRMIRARDVLNTARDHLRTLPTGDRVVELAFYGGTFTAIAPPLQEELLAAAASLKDQGLIDHIRCSTRPDFIDEEVLDRCTAHGMDIIELGVQSLDEAVLARSGRGHDAASVAKASRLIKSYGITLGHQIMPGLPGADPASDLATARASIAMGPDLVRIYPTLVVRDTPLADLYARGEYTPYGLDETVALCAELMTLYEAAGVRILRVGLQSTREISPGADLIAGPWHGALRELAMSCRLHGKLREILGEGAAAQLRINPRDLSVLYAGGKRWFFASGLNYSVQQSDQVPRGQVILSAPELADCTVLISEPAQGPGSLGKKFAAGGSLPDPTMFRRD